MGALIWFLSFVPVVLTFASLCPNIQPQFIFLCLIVGFNDRKVRFYEMSGHFGLFFVLGMSL